MIIDQDMAGRAGAASSAVSNVDMYGV